MNDFSMQKERLQCPARQPQCYNYDSQATFSVMTYNLWKTNGVPTYWDTRKDVLRRQLQQLDPDVLLAQELCPDTLTLVLEALPGHSCIGDSCLDDQVSAGEGQRVFDGWRHEGNIFYRTSMFSLLQWGEETLGQPETLRRLFWARLAPSSHLPCSCCAAAAAAAPLPRSVLFSTAHFTWPGHPAEQNTDINLRKAQTRRTIAALDALQISSDMACFFGGDLNESFWPRRLLEGAGFTDCFSALGLPCRPTHPMRPTLANEDRNADRVLDWVFARGTREGDCEVTLPSDAVSTAPAPPGAAARQNVAVRPLSAMVVRDSVGLSSDDPEEKSVLAVQPSDHAPVLAVYRCF